MNKTNIISRLSAAAMVLASAGSLLAIDATDAHATSSKVRSACRGDYDKFCPGYPLDTPVLRQCMKSKGKNLSIGCRRALAAEGEIPAKLAR